MKKTLLLLLCCLVFFQGCLASEKANLKKLFSNGNFPFSNALGEAPGIRDNILKNQDAFLADLKYVIECDKDGLLTLCDKKHNVGQSFVPSDLVSLADKTNYNFWRKDLSLRSCAEKALTAMAIASKKDEITLLVSSTYRSYEYQKATFQKWVEIDGLEEAERESARAGTSQHQLGTAVDFGSIDDSYAQTAEGAWVYRNASKYGWSLSFPQGYEPVTGYRWECWHFRYIGTAACRFQEKWFKNCQQYMLEFIDAWKNLE